MLGFSGVHFGAELSLFYSLVGVVAGVAFDGPVATPVVKSYDANGWTPKPTSRPMMGLSRRQDEFEDPSFCGYWDGDAGMSLFFSTGSSRMNKSIHYFVASCANNGPRCPHVLRNWPLHTRRRELLVRLLYRKRHHGLRCHNYVCVKRIVFFLYGQ